MRRSPGLRSSPSYSLDAAAQWIERQRDRATSGTAIVQAIVAPDDQEPVGMVGLFGLDQPERAARFGYWLIARARRRGLATSARRLGVRVAGTGGNLRRLRAVQPCFGSCCRASRGDPRWLADDQATRARSRTIRRLLVLASSRSIAAVRSLGGASVDQRLPTRRTSPRPSRSGSRASAFSWLSPAAREAIAVENELGSSSSAARRRSGRRVVSRSFVCGCGCGAGGSAAARTVSADIGLRPIGGSSPKRARQLGHKTTGSRPAGRTISNPRHFRPDRHTPQRRPARSISLSSSVSIGIHAPR